MKYKAKILVKRKDDIKDPQALTLENTLKRLDIENYPNVKIGKFFELDLKAKNIDEAKKKVQKIAVDFLSNVLLEDFEIVEIKEL